MKTTTLTFIFIFSLGLTTLFGQSTRSIEQDEWLLSVGVNAINSQGTKSPVGNISDWAFRFPIAVGAETYFNRLFSIELAASLNGYKTGAPLDAAGPPEVDLTHFALDVHLKYYFGEFVFPETEWLDFYGLAGLGYFSIDGSNISANVGGGAVAWLDRSKSYGIKAQVVAKFAFDHSNTGTEYANNHYQYNLMMIFRL